MELLLCTANVSRDCWDIFHFVPRKEASRRCLEVPKCAELHDAPGCAEANIFTQENNDGVVMVVT